MAPGEPGTKPAYPIRAVDRVCDLLDALRTHPSGLSLTELADTVGLPKSSVLRYLSALESRRYVAREDEDHRYRLGPAVRPDDSREYLERLRTRSQPLLRRLRDRFGETVQLGVLDGTSVLQLEVAEGLHPGRTTRAGDRLPLHVTALGRAAATLLPESRILEILRHSATPADAGRSPAPPDVFLAAVRRCHHDGFAVDDCEYLPESRAIAAALPGLPVPAAVGVSASRARFSRNRAIGTARDLSAQIPDLVRDLSDAP